MKSTSSKALTVAALALGGVLAAAGPAADDPDEDVTAEAPASDTNEPIDETVAGGFDDDFDLTITDGYYYPLMLPQ